jgi:hypothetical protein
VKLFKRYVRIKAIEREVCRLRLGEWRADPQFVAMGATVLAQPNLKLMLDVIENEHPGHYVLPDGTSAQDRLTAQGRAEGYTMALANLRSMGTLARLSERIESTFAPENPET